jgi:hypothetical protein
MLVKWMLLNVISTLKYLVHLFYELSILMLSRIINEMKWKLLININVKCSKMPFCINNFFNLTFLFSCKIWLRSLLLFCISLLRCKEHDGSRERWPLHLSICSWVWGLCHRLQAHSPRRCCHLTRGS